MFEKLQTGEKSMMHQDSLEPTAIRFMLERLQESARRSGCFLPAFFHVSTGTLKSDLLLLLADFLMANNSLKILTICNKRVAFTTIMKFLKKNNT